MFVRIAWLCLVCAAAAAVDLELQLERDAVIQAVNSAKTTWTAGRNFDSSLKRDYARHLLGVRRREGESKLARYQRHTFSDLPDTFDARTQWKHCKSLRTVRDQGPCGSDWAVAAASVFSDRLCILTQGKFNLPLSAENLLSCCSDCGFGCRGGYTDPAWMYLFSTGIPTGGGYHSHQGCQPYTLPKCEHYPGAGRQNCSSYTHVKTPKCRYSCYNKHYKTHKFFDDLHTVDSAFLMNNQTTEMQQEIYTNGPLEATFTVYEDFLSYKTGVYQYTTGEEVGVHAVKLLGWGVEGGVPYWLAANSWNKDWGDGGYFKIRRNQNECLVEQEVTGGTPSVDKIV